MWAYKKNYKKRKNIACLIPVVVAFCLVPFPLSVSVVHDLYIKTKSFNFQLISYIIFLTL